MSITIKKPTATVTPKAIGALQQVQVDTAVAEIQHTHKPKIQASLTEVEVLVDELTMIDAKLKSMEVDVMQKRVDEIKNRLQSVAADMPPEQEAVIKGSIGEVTFSPCRRETTITNKAGIAEKVGAEAFLAMAKVNLTDAKKYLSENELAAFTETGYGSRTLKVVKSFLP
jgi:hypothetical protein